MPRKKSDRVIAIEKKFALDENGLYKCLADGCGVKVRCQDGSGAPGRASHLKQHKEIFETLPKAEERPIKQLPAQPAGQQAAPPQQAPAAKPQKRPRVEGENQITLKPGDVVVNQTNVLRYFARNLDPFARADDELWNGIGLTRHTVPDKMEAAGNDLFKIFLETNKGAFCSISIDGGTNCHQKTLNMCCIVDGVSRCIGAWRIGSHTIENLTKKMSDAMETIGGGLIIASFVSDNAANMRGATLDLALKHRAVFSTCGCHSLNTMVRRVAYAWPEVSRARAIADTVRAVEKSCPLEIDTRWIACFDSFEWIAKNRNKLIADETITRLQVEQVECALAKLQQAELSTLKMEKDDANIFTAVEEYGKALAIFQDDPLFPELFWRNVYSPALVTAAALSPLLAPETIIPPFRAMIEYCLKDVLTDICPNATQRELKKELDHVFDGATQRFYRRDSSKQPWEAGDTPHAQMLMQRLRATAASSSSVERLFSAHARAHSKNRWNLGEDNLMSQLRFHSLLAKERATGKWNEKFPSQENCDRVISWCWAAWQRDREPNLSPGDCVTVWFATGDNRLAPYKCKLMQMEADDGSAWKVRWSSGKDSQQTFKPFVDPWIMQAPN